VDPVVVEELGLLLHNGRELAVLGALDVAVAESMTDLMVDQHLAVRMDVRTIGLRSLCPSVRVDHDAFGGG
jgi:hypothetical protein